MTEVELELREVRRCYWSALSVVRLALVRTAHCASANVAAHQAEILGYGIGTGPAGGAGVKIVSGSFGRRTL